MKIIYTFFRFIRNNKDGLSFFISSLLVVVLSLLLPASSSAQIPGFIIQKATNGGDKIMDPNADGYVSKTTTGFVTNDVGVNYSEIPYRLFPQVSTEPHSDLKTGGSTNFTDLMKDPWYAYFDGTNFMFRVRVGNNSSASKGFSVLIDSDNTFAGTGTNPGFEYEVLLATNFDVRIINLTTNATLFTASHLTNSQRSVALSTTNGNADYFIDFFVPLSGFRGAITAATPLRFSGISVTSAQSGITGTAADIGGVNDLEYLDRNQIWNTVINNFPATSLTNLTTSEFACVKSEVPIITKPIKNNSTSISGTTNETDGTIIRIYSAASATPTSRTLLGTATATNGSWTVTQFTGTLTTGSLITATATSQNPVKCESNLSASVEVLSGTSTSTSTSGTVCNLTAPIITGSSSTGNSNKGLTGTTSVTGSHTITLWVLDPATGNYKNPFSSGITNSVTVTGTTWTLADNGGNNILTGSYIAVATQNGCTASSAPYCYPTTSTATTAPTITTSYLLPNSTTISGTSSNTTGSVSLYINGSRATTTPTGTTFISGAVNATGGWTITIPANILAVGDVVTVRALANSACISGVSTNSIKVYNVVTPTPAITGTYCAPTTGGTTLTLTGTGYPGARIRLYNGTTELTTNPSSVYVTSNGSWGATITGINTTSVVRAVAFVNNEYQSNNSAAAVYTLQTPVTSLVISTPINGGGGANGTVTGTAPANATVNVYIDGALLNTTTAQANGSWSIINLSSLELYVGGLITATVTSSGSCESAQVTGGYVQCNTAPLLVSASFTSAVSNICNESQVSASVSNSENGVYYQLTYNNINTGNPVVGTGGAIAIVSGPITANGTLRLVARKNYSAYCETVQTSTSVTINGTVPTKPIISFSPNPICYNSTATISISSGLVSGDKYQLKKDGILVGTEVTYNGVAFTFTTDAITNASVYTVVHKNTAGCTSTSDPITISPQGPDTNRNVTVNKNSICAGETVTISVATEFGGATPYTYQIFQSVNGGTATQVGGTLTGNGLVQSITTPSLTTAGNYVYTVRVTSSTCPTRALIQSQTVTVGQTLTTASVSSALTACYSTTLTGNQPVSGIGTWTVESKPTNAPNPILLNPNQYNTLVAGLTSGTYTFRWTISPACTGGGTPSSALLTVNANCPTTYNVNSPYFVNGYENLDVVAFAYDTEGFQPNITNFSLISGALPPGTSLNSSTGEIYVSNSTTLSKVGIYSYSFTITAKDALNNTTANIPVTLTFYPAASETSMSSSPYSVLPVELLYFRAKLVNGSVNLLWATATEKENKGFEVEKSLDGKIFKKVGHVVGAGNSLAVLQYAFQDKEVVPGTAYYRLKQVDFAGTFAYSPVVAINATATKNQPKLLAYPNPTKGKITLALETTTAEDYSLEVRDLTGKLVLLEKAIYNEGNTELVLNLQNLPVGTYLVTARSEASVLVTRIIRN